uniref:TRIM8/14/16/25/29/45/65 coiled-coil region domain-containing protein n=1 Tax=Scophthalmus maximus TaxID=52904 RepID=A0A8D3B3J7_SCOMX
MQRLYKGKEQRGQIRPGAPGLALCGSPESPRGTRSRKAPQSGPVLGSAEREAVSAARQTAGAVLRTDQQSVCSRCVKGRHSGHDAVPLADERTAQQKKLQEASLKSAQRLKDAEKELRYIIRNVKHSTDAAVEESERIFSRLIRSMEKQSCEVKELIRLQERAAVSHAEELLEKLQREISELRRTDAELEKLCRAEDHLHFIQKSKSFNFPTTALEMPNTDAPTYLMYKTTREALARLKESVDETLEREFNRISEKVNSLKEICNQRTSEKTKGIQINVFLFFTKKLKNVICISSKFVNSLMKQQQMPTQH